MTPLSFKGGHIYIRSETPVSAIEMYCNMITIQGVVGASYGRPLFIGVSEDRYYP
jgi:hypothetical protein